MKAITILGLGAKNPTVYKWLKYTQNSVSFRLFSY